jgi:transposase
MWLHMNMKPPIYVREKTVEEKRTIQTGLHASSAFTVRRCQILLSSAEGKTPRQIADQLHCSDQTVRNAIRAFEAEGIQSLQAKSHARHDQRPEIDEAGLKRIQELVRMSPRTVGHKTSLWTRPLLAETLWRETYTKAQMSPTTISRALQRAGIDWQRAKNRVRSPDEHYAHRKKDVSN